MPSTADFLEAILCGLGWGMVPEQQFGPRAAAQDLVRLPGSSPVGVGLYWQRWRLESPALDALSEAVRRAATDSLRTAQSGRTSKPSDSATATA